MWWSVLRQSENIITQHHFRSNSALFVRLQWTLLVVPCLSKMNQYETKKRRYTIWEAAKPSRVPDVDSPLTITTKRTWLDIKHPLCWKHGFSFTPLCHINANYLETISNILCRDENWWLCGSQGKFKCFLDISAHYLSQCDNWPVVTLIQVMTISCTTVYCPAKMPARNFTNN